MRKLLLFIIFFCLILTPRGLFALSSPGDAPALLVPFSARASAMGNSLLCSEEDGLRYNAAYLGMLEAASLYATYGLLQRGVSFASAGVVVPAGDSGIALGVSDIRTRFDAFAGPDDAASTVSVGQSLISAAIGIRGADEHVLGGIAARVLIDSIGGTSATGTSIDVGAGYRFDERLGVGLILNNAMSISSNDDDKAKLGIALGMNWLPFTANTISVAVSKSMLADPSFSVGWENMLYESVALRAGFDREYPSAGIGIKLGMAVIDAAAAFKSAGPLYFTTFGWRFAADLEESAAKEAPDRKNHDAIVRQDVEKENRERIEAYIAEGWIYYREAKYSRAEKRFLAALSIDPDNADASNGIKAVKNAQKNEDLQVVIVRGQHALQAKNYSKAEEAFRYVLNKDPSNADAGEGSLAAFVMVSQEIKTVLSAAATAPLSLPKASGDEAQLVIKSGTFANMVTAMQLLSQKKYRDAYAELSKIKPESCQFISLCCSAVEPLRAREIKASFEAASANAGEGAYRDAVNELEYNLSFKGTTREETARVKAQVAVYEYLGKMVAKTYMPEVQRLMAEHQYPVAEVYLKRVIKSGYDADEAQRLLKEIQASR